MFVFQLPAIIGTPRPAFSRRLRTPVCKQISLPPSFTFRPPSNEPPYEDDNGINSPGQSTGKCSVLLGTSHIFFKSVFSLLLKCGLFTGHLVPVDITISNYGSSMEVSLDMSGSSLDVPPSPYSSSYSDNSSYVENTVDENTLGIPRITEEPHRKSTSPQQKQRLRDRKLVRQKSCEYESPPATALVEPIRTPNISRCMATSCDNPVSQSQPTLNKNLYDGEEGSKVNKAHNPIIKLKCLHRSQSSGSEKVRLREKHVAGARVQLRPTTLHALVNALSNYSQEQNALALPNIQVTQNSPAVCKKKLVQHRRCEGHQGHLPNPTLPCSNSSSKHSLTQAKRSSTCESDSYDLSAPDWAAEEAACDEEVRRITGDSTDHDDVDDLEDVTDSCPLVTHSSNNHISQDNSSNSQETLVGDRPSRTQRKSDECCIQCDSVSSPRQSPTQAPPAVPSPDPSVVDHENPPSPDNRVRKISQNSDSKESQNSDTDLSGGECSYEPEALEPMLGNSGDVTSANVSSGALLNVPVISSEDSCVRRRTPNFLQQAGES